MEDLTNDDLLKAIAEAHDIIARQLTEIAVAVAELARRG